MSVQPSAFDTAVLELPVSRISGTIQGPEHLRNVLANAKEQGCKLVFWSATDAEVGGCIDGFLKCVPRETVSVNTRSVFGVDINRSLISALSHRKGVEQVQVREFRGTQPTPELISLALASGMQSRFATDSKLSIHQYRNMYTEWMKNSVQRKVADVVFVAYVTMDGTEHVAGFLTAQLRNGTSEGGLMAVSEECKGMGVALALIKKVLTWTTSKEIYNMTFATQSKNQAAVTLYKSCGGEVKDTIHDVHFWLDAESGIDEYASNDVPNSKPCLGTQELENLHTLFKVGDIRTNAAYGQGCENLLKRVLGAEKVLLVGSGTQALELCSLLMTLEADAEFGKREIIVPSYSFVSTANAFAIHGTTPVFVDIRKDTQNIDETKIEAAIRPGVTRAIVVVHYAGVPCEMDEIMRIARKHNLFVIEDNAHGIFSTYKGKQLGTIGDLGCFSFHYTKNIVCGEGGAVAINNSSLIAKAMIVYEKGTNRSDFLNGRISKYAWVSKGGSFPLGEIAAAVLLGQLTNRDEIQASRLRTWTRYHAALEELERAGRLHRPKIPLGCEHNAHMYYIRVPAMCDLEKLVQVSKLRKISIFTHYEPLHSSVGGMKLAKVSGRCAEAEACGQQLCRLPMWAGLTDEDINRVIGVVHEAFEARPSKDLICRL